MSLQCQMIYIFFCFFASLFIQIWSIFFQFRDDLVNTLNYFSPVFLIFIWKQNKIKQNRHWTRPSSLCHSYPFSICALSWHITGPPSSCLQWPAQSVFAPFHFCWTVTHQRQLSTSLKHSHPYSSTSKHLLYLSSFESRVWDMVDLKLTIKARLASVHNSLLCY